VAVAGLAFAMRPAGTHTPQPPTSASPPTSSSPSPSASQKPVVEPGGVPTLLGNVVTLKDGSTVTIDSSADNLGKVVVTSRGLVYATGSALWWQPWSARAQKITSLSGDFVVSRDGTTVVAAGLGSGHSTEVAAFHLPSLSKFASTTYSRA